jgi:hypothetical protein
MIERGANGAVTASERDPESRRVLGEEVIRVTDLGPEPPWHKDRARFGPWLPLIRPWWSSCATSCGVWRSILRSGEDANRASISFVYESGIQVVLNVCHGLRARSGSRAPEPADAAVLDRMPWRLADANGVGGRRRRWSLLCV